jgi:hypothetical protein
LSTASMSGRNWSAGSSATVSLSLIAKHDGIMVMEEGSVMICKSFLHTYYRYT